MPFPLASWRSSRLRRRRDPFARAKHGDLDIATPPPYEMSSAPQRDARARVAEHIRQLQPGGLDGGSRYVLDEMISAWMEQEIARAESHRLERDAVSSILIGLAREETARREPRYAAHYTRVQHARQALAAAYRELTGQDLADLPVAHPDLSGAGPARSALGAVDLSCTTPHRDPPADPPDPGAGPLPGQDFDPGAPPSREVPGLNGHEAAAAMPSGTDLPEET